MEQKSKPKAASRSTVLDLRQAGGARTAPRAGVVRRPTPPPPLPVRPSSARPASPAPVASPKPAASQRPQHSTEFTDAALSPAIRRFWPAFWRFLLLLIVLGLILTGGLYIYLNYYTH